MKSIINGKEIPDNELWVWNVHETCRNGKYLGPKVYDGSGSRDPSGSCNGCGQEINEQFELVDPLGTGCYFFCHKCTMKFKKVLPGWHDWCPVCGFSENSTGPDGHGCNFGHLWTEQNVKKKIPKKKDSRGGA